MDRLGDDGDRLGEIEQDAGVRRHVRFAPGHFDPAGAGMVELKQQMVEALLRDHARRPFQDLGRGPHLTHKQIAEMIIVHRDRTGQQASARQGGLEDRQQSRDPIFA